MANDDEKYDYSDRNRVDRLICDEDICDEPWHPVWWHLQDILEEDLLDRFPHCKAELVACLRKAADLIEANEFHN
jgi:hypothetical protein